MEAIELIVTGVTISLKIVLYILAGIALAKYIIA